MGGVQFAAGGGKEERSKEALVLSETTGLVGLGMAGKGSLEPTQDFCGEKSRWNKERECF